MHEQKCCVRAAENEVNTTTSSELAIRAGNVNCNKSAHLHNDFNILIGKKVEVCLRLFDIFERNRVFILLLESWGTHPADWSLK